MTQEEKLEEAKRLYETANADQKYVLERLFPELMESEDERIRRQTLKVLNYYKDEEKSEGRMPTEIDECIAWLEKQGEQKPNPVIDIEIPFGAKDSELQEASYHIPEGFHAEIEGNRVVIKRGEQKPADKVEPKFKVKYANSEYNVLEIKEIAGVTYYGIEDEPNHIDYVLPENCEIISGYGIKENGSLYPTKPAKFSEQNPAWSEEDELHIRELESLVKQEWAIAERENDKDKTHKMSDLSFFLKTLKPQLKQEWSEEDERIKQDIENLIHFALKDGSAVSPAADTTKEGALVWLKYLKERHTWKPSDEQIQVLQWCMPLWIEPKSKAVLESLLNDLKKLRKE